MKILLTGAFATGKSSLCRLLVDQLLSQNIATVLVTEVPRRCPFALNRDQTPLASAWLIGEQIRAETEAMVTDCKVVVCDRGIPDIISHTLVLSPHTDKYRRLTSTLITIARAWCNSYDLIFSTLLDPSFPIASERVRVPDKTYQSLLQQSLHSTFKQLHISPEELPSDTERRLVHVRERVLAMLKPRGLT